MAPDHLKPRGRTLALLNAHRISKSEDQAVKLSLTTAPHLRHMPVFAYSIAADQHRPSEGDGYVRAETIRQAVALVGHPEVNV